MRALQTSIPRFVLMPNGDNADQAFGRRIFIQRNVAGFPAGHDQFTKA